VHERWIDLGRGAVSESGDEPGDGRDPRHSDEALIQELREELSSLQRYASPDAWRAAALAWCYDRERYMVDGAPPWVLSVAPWLPARAAPGLPGEKAKTTDKGLFIPSDNILRIAVDTVLAHLLTTLPRLRVGVEGTGLRSLFLSRDRSEALNSTANDTEPQRSLRRAAIDVALAGIGFVKPAIRQEKLRYEQRQRWQVLWDPDLAREEEPEELHEWYAVSQRALIAQLKAEGVDDATIKRVADLSPGRGRVPCWSSDTEIPSDPYDWLTAQRGLQRSRTQLIVSEHYLLATAPGEPDGRHVIVAWGGDGQAVVVHDELFDRDSAPIITWCYQPPRKGCQSVGLGDMLLWWQRKVDRGQITIGRAVEVLCQPHLIGDETLFKHLASDDVNFIPAKTGAFGEGPRFELVKNEPISVDLAEYVDGLGERALRNAGVSQMLSEGVSQLGANAPAIALQAEERRVKDRLARVVAERDRALIRLGVETLHALDDLVARQPKAKAQWQVYGDQRSQPWKELLPPRADRHVAIEVTGAASGSYAAQLAIVQDFSDRGLVSPITQRLAMLDDPDMRRVSAYELAPIKLVLVQMERLIRDDGDALELAQREASAMPTANTDYAVADEISLRTVQLADALGDDDDVMIRLEKYRAALQEFKPQPPATPPMPGAGGMPTEMAAGMMAA
jgi:hypothetical protein